jgi:CheY-like chemotaxis protein
VPSYVKGDITRLTQILNNLISNAIKFTKNGRVTIELQLKSRFENRSEIVFSIKDTGIGISKESQELIFERFTQEHSYITREYGGSGLGLTIIRKLLNMMDSDIYVESEQGKGSEFYFTLWLEESNVVTEIAPQRVIAGDMLAGKRVLLVEDVDFNLLLATKILERWQIVVSVAKNGLQALELARNNEYDMILMDVQMPVMDGISASREIRQFNKDVYIVALTASTSNAMQEKFNKIGINGYVYKPIDPDLLYKTMVRLFFKNGDII